MESNRSNGLIAQHVLFPFFTPSFRFIRDHECPDCKKHIEIFGKSHVDEVAAEYNLPVLGKIPMTPAIAAASDAGDIESLDGDWFATAIPAIEAASKA